MAKKRKKTQRTTGHLGERIKSLPETVIQLDNSMALGGGGSLWIDEDGTLYLTRQEEVVYRLFDHA